MDVDLTRLRYFVAVAEELHFARAAERLRISPPPLSRQIKLLESQLGAELFERHYHEVRLTALGRTLLPQARATLEAVQAFRSAAARAVRAEPPLRVGATAYAPSHFLRTFQDCIEESFPDASIDIVGSAADVKAQLLAGRLDLGLLHLPVQDRRLSKRVVASYPTALAVRADDPLAGQQTVRIEHVKDREILVDFARPNPELLAWTIRQLTAAGLTRLVHSPTTTGGELELANHAYAHGLAVMLPYAPESFVGRMFSAPEFVLLPFDADSYPPAQLALAWLPDAAASDERIGRTVDALAERMMTAPVG